MDQTENKTKNCHSKYEIIILGLLIHILLLLAVFDVYFSSPLDQGMTQVIPSYKSPAKRVVLFVADGLRAEAIYEKNEKVQTPFLFQMKEIGSWGVAHTRVPTESRPGHVAILGGIYEDPSAILKGWKANPVYFDSVINRSNNAWCWGSPDIVNLFTSGKSSTIHHDTYGSEMEDFGKNNTGLLDMWVYNKVKHFFKDKVQSCSGTDCDQYYSEGNLFFLHLLGIDTAGHGYKPNSKEYINNIKLVDKIMSNVTELFKRTYKDDLTAFIFTADHGMSDWGSHGSGSIHETEVPIIAWGAGIKNNEKRQDLNQIDIAPLLSSLIGISIPVNSLGILPTNYLNMSVSDLSNALLCNTLQLLKIFNVKRLRTESNAMIYLPFKHLTTELINEQIWKLGQLNKSYEKRVEKYVDFMNLIIDGINYYHNYYQYPVLISISFGFLEWIAFLSIVVFFNDKRNSGFKIFKKLSCVASVLIVLFLCYKQKFPLTYYLYFSFPVVMFFIILENLKLQSVVRSLRNIGSVGQVVSNLLFYIIGIELLIYGFFNRLAFTILMVLVGIWVFLSESLNRNTNTKEKCIWMGCAFILAVFPTLPVMKTAFNVPLYVCGTIGWIFLFKEMYLNKILSYYSGEINTNYLPFFVQFFCLILASLHSLLLENGTISNDSNIKYISWLILVLPIFMIPFTNTFIAVRLIATFFAFAPFYLLVSPNYEVLFSAFYVALLCTWLLIESKSFHFGNISNIIYYVKFETYRSNNKINSDIFRRAFLFMVFIFLGFFGTGNIASLNSFDPMWVRAFLTVFSPFKMAGLILLKLMVPFIFTCCVFRAINSVGKENVLNTFCIILIFSDLMVLQFLYLITNVGSWLDIGTSLSHFIIMEAFVMILLVLYGLAHVLTTITY